MGDYTAIRYQVKIKQELIRQVADANNRIDGDEILSWNRAGLTFDDPVARKVWAEFLNNPISLTWPDSDMLHHNPSGWAPVPKSFSWLTGTLKGAQCFKVIPGGIAALVAVLPLIAVEWKVEVDIRDMLFSLDYTGTPVDIYSNRGNDLFKDRCNSEPVSGYGF